MELKKLFVTMLEMLETHLCAPQYLTFNVLLEVLIVVPVSPNTTLRGKDAQRFDEIMSENDKNRWTHKLLFAEVVKATTERIRAILNEMTNAVDEDSKSSRIICTSKKDVLNALNDENKGKVIVIDFEEANGIFANKKVPAWCKFEISPGVKNMSRMFFWSCC